jgi:succinate dehydrogenase / fumarate reductase, cytochrome b subunit
MKRRYAFFPGCVLEKATQECHQATMAVAKALDWELVEIPGWSCCGASHVQDIDDKAALTINARNLALSEVMGLPILTVCSTCTLMLRKAKMELDNGAKEEINTYLAKAGLVYQGTATVTHLLWELVESKGEWLGKISKPLSGVRVSPFYGCHTLRPPEVQTFENPLAPDSLEQLIAVLGAIPAPTQDRLKCCGFHAAYPAEADVLRNAGNIIGNAADVRSDCLVTPCPLCQMQLDVYQPEARAAAGTNAEVPCLHLAQFVGLGLGISPGELGLERHIARFTKI